VLREISGVRQDRAEVRRRWFQDDYLDLFVWTRADGDVTAFQLAYDRSGDEHLIEWEAGRGYLHRRVLNGDGDMAGMPATPLLAIGGRFPKYRVLAEFERRSIGMHPALREAVRRGLAAFDNPGRRRSRLGRRRAYRL
jgi:hypothetical protein